MADSPWKHLKTRASEAHQALIEGFEPIATRGDARRLTESQAKYGQSAQETLSPGLDPAELARRQAEISAKYAERERLRRAREPVRAVEADGYKLFRKK